MYQPIKINLCVSTLREIKRALRDALRLHGPAPGSAHVSEAMACAMGFGTHARMLESMERPPIPVAFHAAVFLERLRVLVPGIVTTLPGTEQVHDAVVASVTYAGGHTETEPFLARWGALHERGIHIVCAGNDLGPARGVDMLCRRMLDRMPEARVLRFSSRGMVLSTPGMVGPGQMLASATMEVARSMEEVLRCCPLPDLAVLDDVNGRTMATLAFRVARRGVPVVMGVRARTAFAAIAALDMMGIGRNLLGDPAMVKQVDVLSHDTDQGPMLLETRKGTHAYLNSAVARLPGSPRKSLPAWRMSPVRSPDPASGRGPFRLVLADVMEAMAAATMDPQGVASLHGHRVSLPPFRWAAPALEGMSTRLRDQDDHAAMAWALERMRQARRDVARQVVSEGMLAPEVMDHPQGIIHRNMLVGLLAELPGDHAVFVGTDGRHTSAVAVIQAARNGHVLALAYGDMLFRELCRGIVHDAQGPGLTREEREAKAAKGRGMEER